MRWRVRKIDGLWTATNQTTGLRLWFAKRSTAYSFVTGIGRAR